MLARGEDVDDLFVSVRRSDRQPHVAGADDVERPGRFPLPVDVLRRLHHAADAAASDARQAFRRHTCEQRKTCKVLFYTPYGLAHGSASNQFRNRIPFRRRPKGSDGFARSGRPLHRLTAAQPPGIQNLASSSTAMRGSVTSLTWKWIGWAPGVSASAGTRTLRVSAPMAAAATGMRSPPARCIPGAPSTL